MLKPTPGADGNRAFLQHDLHTHGSPAAGDGLTTYFSNDATGTRLSVLAVVRRKPGGREILLMQRSDVEDGGREDRPVRRDEPRPPEGTLGIAILARDAPPEPFLSIHRNRVADAFAGAAEACIR